jgi:hypothetical protein
MISKTNSSTLAEILYRVAYEDSTTDKTISIAERSLLLSAVSQSEEIVTAILQEVKLAKESDTPARIQNRIERIEECLKVVFAEEMYGVISEFNATNVQFLSERDILTIQELNAAFFRSEILIPIPVKGKALYAHGIPVSRLGFILHDLFHALAALDASSHFFAKDEAFPKEIDFIPHYTQKLLPALLIQKMLSKPSTTVQDRVYGEVLALRYAACSHVVRKAIGCIYKDFVKNSPSRHKKQVDLGLFYLFHEDFSVLSEFKFYEVWPPSNIAKVKWDHRTLLNQLESVVKIFRGRYFSDARDSLTPARLGHANTEVDEYIETDRSNRISKKRIKFLISSEEVALKKDLIQIYQANSIPAEEDFAQEEQKRIIKLLKHPQLSCGAQFNEYGLSLYVKPSKGGGDSAEKIRIAKAQPSTFYELNRIFSEASIWDLNYPNKLRLDQSESLEETYDRYAQARFYHQLTTVNALKTHFEIQIKYDSELKRSLLDLEEAFKSDWKALLQEVQNFVCDCEENA